MGETPKSLWRTFVRESPTHGRVLEVVLLGPVSPAFWDSVRELLQQEVAGRRPDYLVIDLRSLDSIYGVALVSVLVVGAAAMEERGLRHRTRILATGDIAHMLPAIIKISKMDSLLGGRVYPNLESALMGSAGAS